MRRGKRYKNESYKAKSREFIRQQARDLRKQLNIDSVHEPDLYYVILTLKMVFPHFKLKIVSDADLPYSDARAYCKAWVLTVRKSILVLLSHYGDGRARWTVAHELGHLVLQHPKSRLDRKRPDEPILESVRVFEDEADIFASEFLAPSHLAAKCHTHEEIRALFQISPPAAIRRKKELDEARKVG